MVKYVNIKIPEKLSEEIDKLVDKKLKGYRSRGEFVATAVREKLREFSSELSPRFEHFNVYEDHVTIFDRSKDKLVDVYLPTLKTKKAYCEDCDLPECDHTRFALKIPKVVRALKDKGWVVEEGKIVRGPF